MESVSNHNPPQKDYRQLQKILKKRCEEISKDNDALSSRLINLKLLIYKSENQCRKLKNRLEYHGVDYHAAAVTAANDYADTTNFTSEADNAKSHQKNIKKKRNKAAPQKSSSTLPDTSLLKTPTVEFDTDLSSGFLVANGNHNSV